jgi:hypothetical protein
MELGTPSEVPRIFPKLRSTPKGYAGIVREPVGSANQRRAASSLRLFPMFLVPEGDTPYRAGIALGIRDAIASIPDKAGTEPSMEDWFNDALRRR